MDEQERAWRELRDSAKNATNTIAGVLEEAKRLTVEQRLWLERTLANLEWHIDGTYEAIRQNRRDRQATKSSRR